MTLLRAMALLSALTLAGLSEAAAQFPPPPGQNAPATQSSPFPPPPGQQQQSSPFPPPGAAATGQPVSHSRPVQSRPRHRRLVLAGRPAAGPPPPGAQPPPVCLQFAPIREQAEKDGGAIKIASDRKAQREEICALFTKFVGSEGRMVKFLETNQKVCGVPPDAIKHVRGQHAKSQQIRKQVCATGRSAWRTEPERCAGWTDPAG